MENMAILGVFFFLFLFFQLLDVWWFFTKILTKLLEFTIEKETFQNFSNFIVKRVTKFHKNVKYNEFFVAYSHLLGKKSLDFEGEKNKILDHILI